MDLSHLPVTTETTGGRARGPRGPDICSSCRPPPTSNLLSFFLLQQIITQPPPRSVRCHESEREGQPTHTLQSLWKCWKKSTSLDLLFLLLFLSQQPAWHPIVFTMETPLCLQRERKKSRLLAFFLSCVLSSSPFLGFVYPFSPFKSAQRSNCPHTLCYSSHTHTHT